MSSPTKSDLILNGSLIVLALCAITTTTLTIKREISRGKQTQQIDVVSVKDWRHFASSGPRVGNPNAPVTVVEFYDFQCPYCRTMEPRIREVFARHPQDIAIVYQNFPLDIHQFATPAAHAADCADKQGSFKPFHDTLFAHTDSLAATPWTEFATRAGVRNLKEFQRCMADNTIQSKIDHDIDDAKEIGVTGTPTFLINDKKITGTLSTNQLDGYIRQELERIKSSKS